MPNGVSVQSSRRFANAARAHERAINTVKDILSEILKKAINTAPKTNPSCKIDNFADEEVALEDELQTETEKEL